MLPIAATGRLGSNPVERLERGIHVRYVDNFFWSKKFKPGSGCTCSTSSSDRDWNRDPPARLDKLHGSENDDL